MLNSYNAKTGIVFALVIAALATTPRLIRLDTGQLVDIFSHFLYLSSCIFGSWLIHHFFLQRVFNIRLMSSNTGKGIASVVAGMVFIVAITYLYRFGTLYALFIPLQELSIRQVVLVYTFRAFIISSFTYFTVYYFSMFVLLQRSKLENEYLKREQLMAALASLRQQISPHFLFNSLNTLLAISQEEAVKEYIIRLSELYRHVLRFQEQNNISVRDELMLISSYLQILELRFERGLQVNVEVRPSALEKKIMPLALQLLVENAVKHNSTSFEQPLVVTITDSDGYLVVSNRYQPKLAADQSTGIGLKNLEQRYRLAAGREINIIRNADTFSVAIPLLS